jgi:hypothetical protein
VSFPVVGPADLERPVEELDRFALAAVLAEELGESTQGLGERVVVPTEARQGPEPPPAPLAAAGCSMSARPYFLDRAMPTARSGGGGFS